MLACRCSKVVRQANGILVFLARSLAFRNIITIVQDDIDAVHGWLCIVSPYFRKGMLTLKAVLERITLLITGMKRLFYYEQPKMFDLSSLEFARMRADHIETYMILKVLDRRLSRCFHSWRVARGWSFKTEVHMNVFLKKIVNLWNFIHRELWGIDHWRYLKRRWVLFWKIRVWRTIWA